MKRSRFWINTIATIMIMAADGAYVSLMGNSNVVTNSIVGIVVGIVIWCLWFLE